MLGSINALPSTNRIAFTSDVHIQTGVNNLIAWTNSLSNNILSLDQFIFGGDYHEYFTSGTEIEEACVTTVNSKYPDADVYLARENHDAYGQYPYSTGLVVDHFGNNYGVYIMDIDVSNPAFRTSDIDALETILNAAPSYEPIFIVSHIQLHYYNNNGYARQYKNAPELLNVLKNFSNVVFLWGHNHSQNDPAYGSIITPQDGETIKCTATSQQININFTYASMGSMKEGANRSRYGLYVSMAAKGFSSTVSLLYKNTNGTTPSGVSVNLPFIIQ